MFRSLAMALPPVAKRYTYGNVVSVTKSFQEDIMKERMFLTALFVFGGFSAFSQQLPTVAVATFDRIGGVTAHEAQVVTELFITELVSKGLVNVVDRANFDKIIAEMQFQLSDWSNSQKTALLGQASNAGYIIRGQLMKMENIYYWTATMLDINTAQVLYSAREQVANMSQISDKLPAFVKQIVDNTPLPNYFVGRWRSVGERKDGHSSGELVIEMSANGSVRVISYRYRNRNYKGTGNYTFTNSIFSIQLSITGPQLLLNEKGKDV
jgi:TolB-like protein